MLESEFSSLYKKNIVKLQIIIFLTAFATFDVKLMQFKIAVNMQFVQVHFYTICNYTPLHFSNGAFDS